MAPIMYGPDGRKEFVFPWAVDDRQEKGWTLEPKVPQVDQPTFQPIAASPLVRTPVDEAVAARNADLERAGGLGIGEAISGSVTSRSLGPVTSYRWVDTDILGRPVYAVWHERARSYQRLALDTSGGIPRLVEAAGSLVEPVPVATTTPLRDLTPGDHQDQASIFNDLSLGRISLTDARAALEGTGLTGSEIDTLFGPNAQFQAERIDAGIRLDQAQMEGEQPHSGEFPIDSWMLTGNVGGSGLPSNLNVGGSTDSAEFYQRVSECIASGFSEGICRAMVAREMGTEDEPASGGGRGYIAPDRDLVKDSVKGLLIQLVGESDSARVEQLVDIYMRDHRRASGGASVDPAQSVRTAIRSYDDYKRIHRLRPEQMDEADWIPNQFSQLMAAGVRTSALDQRAIIQAQAGVNPVDAGEAAELSELQLTRRPLPAFLQKFRQVAEMGFRRVN